MVEVILRKDARNLGRAGQIVKVKDGYARNYLLPKGIAYLATKENIKKWEQEKRRLLKQLEKQKASAQELAERLSKVSVNIAAEANEEETLYGSITEAHIASALKEEGIDIDKDSIVLPVPIKKLGVYNVEIGLHPEVKAEVKVWVVKK